MMITNVITLGALVVTHAMLRCLTSWRWELVLLLLLLLFDI